MANQKPVYRIVSMVKNRATRAHRRAGAVRGETKQYVMAGTRRLIPERDVMITHEELQTHLEEFRDRTRRGMLEVRTNDGRRVNLDTLEPAPSLALPPPPAPPDFSLETELGREPPKLVLTTSNTTPLTPTEAAATVAEMAGVTTEDMAEDVLADMAGVAPVEPEAAETAEEVGETKAAEEVPAEETETPVEPAASEQGSSRRNRKRGG